jgi:hypothetical protein
VRKAVQAAALLGASAFLHLASHQSSPLFAPVLFIAAAAAALAGFWFLLRDPVMSNPSQRGLLIAAIVAALSTWLLPLVPGIASWLARTLTLLGTMAFLLLPTWLLARRERWVGLACAVVGAALGVGIVTATPSVQGALADAQSFIMLGGTAAASWILAWRLHRRGEAAPRKKHVAIAWNPERMSKAERDRRAAKLEARYRSGEIPEHEYLDRLQELDDR